MKGTERREGRHEPTEMCEVDILNAIALEAQLHQAVHLLETIYVVNHIPVCAKLAQMSKTF